MTGKLSEKLVELSFRLGDEQIKKLENMFSSPEKVLIPWLVDAYELETMMPFVRDVPDFFEDGLKNATNWSDKRGLLTALKTALSWIGFLPFNGQNGEQNSAQFIEAKGKYHWAEYSILLRGKKPDDNDISKIKGVCRLSEPARSRLTRISHESHNLRRMSLSSKNAGLSKNPLSNDSGVYKNSILISKERTK